MKKGSTFPLKLDRHGVSGAILRFACNDANPAFADAILFDVGLLDAVEADADFALQNLFVEVRALWVVAKPVRKFIAHRRSP